MSVAEFFTPDSPYFSQSQETPMSAIQTIGTIIDKLQKETPLTQDKVEEAFFDVIDYFKFCDKIRPDLRKPLYDCLIPLFFLTVFPVSNPCEKIKTLIQSIETQLGLMRNNPRRSAAKLFKRVHEIHEELKAEELKEVDAILGPPTLDTDPCEKPKEHHSPTTQDTNPSNMDESYEWLFDKSAMEKAQSYHSSLFKKSQQPPESPLRTSK